MWKKKLIAVTYELMGYSIEDKKNIDSLFEQMHAMDKRVKELEDGKAGASSTGQNYGLNRKFEEVGRAQVFDRCFYPAYLEATQDDDLEIRYNIGFKEWLNRSIVYSDLAQYMTIHDFKKLYNEKIAEAYEDARSQADMRLEQEIGLLGKKEEKER